MKPYCALLLGLAMIAHVSACQANPTPTLTVTPTPTTAPATSTPEPTATTDLPPALRGTVHIWLDWNPEELISLHQVIAAFQDRNAEVLFSIAYYPEDALQPAFETATVEGNAPSILFAPASWGPELWQGGLVLDLTSRADAELQATIDPLAWSQVVYDGALIGLPLERQGMVLYRNRSLATEAASTLDDFVGFAQELRDGQIVGACLDLGFMYSVSHMAACEGNLFDEIGDLAIDNQAGLCWLRLLRSLGDAGRMVFNTDEDLMLFETGKSGWLIKSSLEAPRLTQAIGAGNLVIDPWPIYTEMGKRLAGFVWTENIYMVNGSSTVDEEVSWEFARFLLTPEAQLILSNPEAANHLPAYAYLELADALQSQMIASLSSGVSPPLRTDLSLYIEPLESAVRMVAVHGASPELALDMAVKKIEQEISGNGVEE